MNNTMTLNLNEMEMVNGGWDFWGSIKGALIGGFLAGGQEVE